MPEWLAGLLVGWFLSLSASVVLHFLARRDRREELAEARLQARRESAYFEAMDYLARRFSNLFEFARTPWDYTPATLDSGSLGRLEIVAGKEVNSQARQVLGAITDVEESIFELARSVSKKKRRMDSLNAALTASPPSDNNLRARSDEEQSLQGLRTQLRHSELDYAEEHIKLLEKLTSQMPILSAAQSKLAEKMRAELSIATAFDLAKASKSDAEKSAKRLLESYSARRMEIAKARPPDSEG